VILKVPSNLPENRGVGDHFGFYEREGRFYADLSEWLPVRTPHCYYNHMDSEANEFALMIEDFGGRTMVSQIAGIEFERAAEAVRALALVHAEFWNSPKLESLAWLPTFIDPINLAAGAEYRKSWDHFMELFAGDLPDGSAALGELVGPNFESTLIRDFESQPRTMAHGDFRADNLMFDDSATGRDHVGILDWQIVSESPGVGDIAYLLTQSMLVEDRRTHERELLAIWYESLCAALGGPPAGYPLADAWDGYRSATGFFTVYPVVAGGGMDPSNERGLQLVTEMATRAFTAALDLDAASFITA
jgi:aminoglycoside/choline kinase family phosphotransferase